MKSSEIVRRTLADAAFAGRRRWENLGDLAFEAGTSVTTTHEATRRLSEIGAVRTYARGGLSVTDPERVLTVVAAERNLRRDTLAMTNFRGARLLAERDQHCVYGGTDAAVHHLGGENLVADKGQRILYVSRDFRANELPDGDEVCVLQLDRTARKRWTSGFTSLAQTYADLFAQPGWQAAEFRRALARTLFAIDDWSRAESTDD